MNNWLRWAAHTEKYNEDLINWTAKRHLMVTDNRTACGRQLPNNVYDMDTSRGEGDCLRCKASPSNN